MNEAKLLLLETEAHNGDLATAIAEDGSLGMEIVAEIRAQDALRKEARRVIEQYVSEYARGSEDVAGLLAGLDAALKS